MHQFINARETLVAEAIDGYLQTQRGLLARLDGYPHVRVVVRADWQQDRVALVSGGGSGHEPAHIGFVGKGMLSAAVCGDVFASPSVDAVLSGILAVTGEAGCLLIVKNYTGDRLNFGLAAERARALGLKVSMIIVGDDIALPDLAQPRGLAGTLFVHKVAGALAEAGEPLQVVAREAERVAGSLATVGMALDTCTVPGASREQRIEPSMAELGLGIHGEPGVEQVAFDGARQAIGQIAGKLAPHLGKASHAALLNNLGGLTPLEMSVLTHELAASALAGQISWLVGPGPLMTSLDMRGFSLSVMPVSESDKAALAAPTNAPAWPGLSELAPVVQVPMPPALAPVAFTSSAHRERRVLILRCCQILGDAESELNALDAKSGDGDTGSTLAAAGRALANGIDDLPLADMADLFRAISSELSQSMGGSSGVLLAIFFSAAGDALSSGDTLVQALQAGLARISDVGGARAGDRTLIDALEPALAALPDGLAAAAQAAREGADHTATITDARAGRASYVSASQLKGHRDPGAEAVALLLEQLASN